MPLICPTILAETKEQYQQQMEKIAGFAERIQIDLTDGIFAKKQTIKPEDAWWPAGIKADFHLMYKQPDHAIDNILAHKPNLVIVHAEAHGHFESFAQLLHNLGIKVGVALLPQTSADTIAEGLKLVDHVLIFSGNLGEYGGHADLGLLSKVHSLKHQKPDLEIGWDGGINEQNIASLATGGVDVFNVGAYLQDSSQPEHAYKVLERIAQETGTT
jgi:ribulose-phosphate 3-epimerase